MIQTQETLYIFFFDTKFTGKPGPLDGVTQTQLTLALASLRGGSAIVAMPFIDEDLLWCPDSDGQRLVDLQACLQVSIPFSQHQVSNEFTNVRPFLRILHIRSRKGGFQIEFECESCSGKIWEA